MRTSRGFSRLPTRGRSSDASPSTKRNLISAPFGPVRRSNGADLHRGDVLTIVPSIDSCVAEPVVDNDVVPEDAAAASNNAGPLEQGHAPATKPKIHSHAAGINKPYGGLQQPPAAANDSSMGWRETSTIGAPPNIGRPLERFRGAPARGDRTVPGGSPRPEVFMDQSFNNPNRTEINSGSSAPQVTNPGRKLLAAFSTTHPYNTPSERPLPKLPTQGAYSPPSQRLGNEKRMDSATRIPRLNTPPALTKSDFAIQVEETTQRILTKEYHLAPPPKTRRIAKSRTLAAITNLTGSISRPSLSLSDRKLSSSSKDTPLLSSSPETPSSGRMPESPAREPEPQNPYRIYDAQPSSYWTGRFLARHDRLLSDLNLSAASMRELLQATQSAQPNKNRPKPCQIPHSNTTAALTSLPPLSSRPSKALFTSNPIAGRTFRLEEITRQPDDDALCLEIFSQLERLCATDEARRSLWSWQQSYARQKKREKLLPEGGKMMDEKEDGAERKTSIVLRFLGRKSLGTRPPADSDPSEDVRDVEKVVGEIKGRKKRLSIF